MDDNKQPDPTAERIRATMQRLGMNQAQMAAYLGVPQGTIGNWLGGTRAPNQVVVRLLDVLGMMEALTPAVHASILPRKGN